MLDQIASLGRLGLDRLAGIGRAGSVIWHSLVAKPEPVEMFPLLLKQIYFVGVLSLVIIAVSGLFNIFCRLLTRYT